MNKSDPLGLVEWNGRIEIANITAVPTPFTETRARFFLESECVDGEKYRIKVKADGDFLDSLDISINPVNANASKVQFEDDRKAPDPTVFNGTFYYGSVGFNSAIGGVSHSKVVLGTAVSRGHAFTVGTGDIGVMTVNGSANVVSSERVQCGCQ